MEDRNKGTPSAVHKFRQPIATLSGRHLSCRASPLQKQFTGLFLNSPLAERFSCKSFRALRSATKGSSRLPARSALLPAAEVSTGHPHPKCRFQPLAVRATLNREASNLPVACMSHLQKIAMMQQFQMIKKVTTLSIPVKISLSLYQMNHLKVN